ncbi:hypothetical protein [Bacillus sp. B15-48]|nr:hypothetical protein [Bacillus sp. B15-48]
MSKSYFLTPEEMEQKKKRQKVVLYTSVFGLTILLTSALTILMN